ncbi:MAG: ABC transporter substrate-binding protein [Clostridia bacterium]|nr:ABC transporter substrate-binding protein [Clostridia bacterium]
MTKMRKILAILLVLALVLSMAVACKTEDDPEGEATVAPVEESDDPVVEPSDEPEEPTEEPEPALPTAPTIDTPLVVAYSPFSGKFSPYYADTGYDQDVASMTQLGLMTTDRMGGIIFNAIEGEVVNYNGTDYLYTGPANLSVNYDEATNTTTYTATLREDLYFSDGVHVTADDVIFTYYTYLDPSYVGSTTLSSYDIVGLQNYQTQTSDEVYVKYAAIVEAMYAAGDQGYVENEVYTEEQYNAYWAMMAEEWKADLQAIADYCVTTYAASYAEAAVGVDAATLTATPELSVAFGMWAWGFADGFADDGLWYDAAGASYDLANGVYPTTEEWYAIAYATYGGDPDAYWAAEAADGTDVHGTVDSAFILQYGSQDEAMGGQGVPNISGITKIDDYTVQVVVNGYSAPAVYSILGLSITPLHYYGDVEKYDYENNMFGFDFGDLSKQQALIDQPLGAGPYKFVSYENKVVTFEANPYYYKGCPKIANVLFREIASADVATSLVTGDADAGELTGSKTRFEEVAGYNSNGEVTGDVITTSMVDNLGYGYIGMNADTVNIGGEPASDASKALRKGLATVLAVYRDVAYDSYYGDAAAVIQYPISNTSWAAPQPSDEGYQEAFSVDASGNALYTAEMTAEERYAAAAAGALTWFEAAGYTVENGMVTAAPEGGRTTFNVIIPADGAGDHPSYDVLMFGQQALAAIGIELTITDPADSNVLWDALDAGTQDLWCAAWGSTIDPDMYQVYHSSGVVGEGGSDSNHYHIRDAQLDELIVAARNSDDQSYRKTVYKQCLDIIIDWAVEIPAYQRQNCIVFSTERINIDTLTPDITTFWGWMNDIELLEMN